MRIGLTSNSIEPIITGGKIDGIGTYTKHLYESLLKQGYDVTSFYFPRSRAYFQSSTYPTSKKCLLSYPLATLASFVPPFPSLLYGNLKNQIDLFHSTDHLVPRIQGIPLIATIHDAVMFKEPSWYVFGNFKTKIIKETMKWATHYITGSHTMVSELVEYLGIDEKKISVVYDGIPDFWSFELNIDEKLNILNKFNLPKKFLLFAATLQPKKNLPRLIEAYLQLPKEMIHEYPLIIAGKAGWKTEESLAAIQKLTEKKAGQWIQYVSREELRALYQSATLYLHPSLHEGFGFTILEAYASKTPVITSNVTAMPEIAGDGAYLVNPYSVSDITLAIKKLLSSETLRQELIKRGFERVKIFTLEKSVNKTITVYHKIIENKS